MKFNAERTRAISAEAFGIACYERTDVNGRELTFTHRGTVGTEEDAEAWLKGETPKSLVRIFTHSEEERSRQRTS